MDLLTVAYLLIVLGLALLIAELFLPTSGVLFLVSSLCILGGVVLTFVYDPSKGMVALLAVFVAVPALATLMLYLWPRTPMAKRLILKDRDDVTALSPVHLELEALRGRYGRALSDLRPAGTADFDGRRIDVLSEGMMIPTGSWVRCVEVRAATVVVRKVDAPNLRDLETGDFNS
jgi:membrane-bound serine protease (ClpP class)